MIFQDDGIMFERRKDERSINILFAAVASNKPAGTYELKRVPNLGEVGIHAAEMKKRADMQIARLLGGKAMNPTGSLDLVPTDHFPAYLEPAEIGNRLRASINQEGSMQPFFFLSDSEIPQAIDKLERWRDNLFDEDDPAMEESRQLLDILRYAQSDSVSLDTATQYHPV